MNLTVELVHRIHNLVLIRKNRAMINRAETEMNIRCLLFRLSDAKYRIYNLAKTNKDTNKIKRYLQVQLS